MQTTGAPQCDEMWRDAMQQYIREQARPIEKYGHQPRLYALTLQIGAGLTYDDDLVCAAAWMHDLGVFEGHRPVNPNDLAAWDMLAYAERVVPGLLSQFGFPEQKIPAVMDCIRTHQPKFTPQTLEATILRDADILEQLGAIGILRTVCKVGRDTRFHTFADAVTTLQRALDTLPPLLLLPAARELAASRVEALKLWLQAVADEAGRGAALRLLFAAGLAFVLVSFTRASSLAQQPQPLVFDVASVRQNVSGDGREHTNVPLGPGNVFTPTGGLFSSGDVLLMSFIAFAYKMTDSQLDAFRSAAPGWILKDHFDIQARTDRTGVTKDEFRLMMRTLLAERFHLAVHYEARQTPVFLLSMAKAGVLGPQMRVHPADSPCSTLLPAPAAPAAPPPSETVDGGFPATCGGIIGLPASTVHRYKFGGRDVTMTLFTASIPSWGALGRPVVDRTGLTARYDFVLEFTPDKLAEAADAAGDGGVSFRQAVKEQLGLRLEADKAEVQVLVLDRIEHLTAN